jgi:3-dehydroquinate synthase
MLRLQQLLRRAGLPTAPPSIDPGEWLRVMGMDKKVQNKRLRFVLLKRLGDAYVSDEYDTPRLEKILRAAS